MFYSNAGSQKKLTLLYSRIDLEFSKILIYSHYIYICSQQVHGLQTCHGSYFHYMYKLHEHGPGMAIRINIKAAKNRKDFVLDIVQNNILAMQYKNLLIKNKHKSWFCRLVTPCRIKRV